MKSSIMNLHNISLVNDEKIDRPLKVVTLEVQINFEEKRTELIMLGKMRKFTGSKQENNFFPFSI